MNPKIAFGVLTLWDEMKVRPASAADVEVSNLAFGALREELVPFLNFRKAFSFVLKWERDGYGVAQDTYTAWRLRNGWPDRPVAKISMDEAEDVYFERVWTQAGCGEMGLRVAMVHFDTAAMRGPKVANRMLQEMLGASLDGVIGFQTLSLLKMADEESLLKIYLAGRMAHYQKTCEDNPSEAVFLAEWRKRIESLTREVGCE